MPPMPNRSYTLTSMTKITLGMALVALTCVRCFELVDAWRLSDERPLLAFPLSVIFPGLLVAAMAFAPPAATREGALMRLGTMIACVLVVGLPRLALHLVLGLPIVFLLVELFETRCPPSLRTAIARRLVT